jgi:hypothetical protein
MMDKVKKQQISQNLSETKNTAKDMRETKGTLEEGHEADADV